MGGSFRRGRGGEDPAPKGLPPARSAGGFARLSFRSGKLVETDLYINTAHDEEWSGYTLAYTKKMLEAGRYYGVYAFINSTYAVIPHEIGHAVGWGHLSVAGGLMRSNPAFRPSAIRKMPISVSVTMLPAGHLRLSVPRVVQRCPAELG